MNLQSIKILKKVPLISITQTLTVDLVITKIMLLTTFAKIKEPAIFSFSSKG